MNRADSDSNTAAFRQPAAEGQRRVGAILVARRAGERRRGESGDGDVRSAPAACRRLLRVRRDSRSWRANARHGGQTYYRPATHDADHVVGISSDAGWNAPAVLTAPVGD